MGPGLKTGGVVDPGMKTRCVVGPGWKTGGVVDSKNSTDGGTYQVRGHHPRNIYLIIYKSLYSEKSPLFKVFASHIPVHYSI